MRKICAYRKPRHCVNSQIRAIERFSKSVSERKHIDPRRSWWHHHICHNNDSLTKSLFVHPVGRAIPKPNSICIAGVCNLTQHMSIEAHCSQRVTHLRLYYLLTNLRQTHEQTNWNSKTARVNLIFFFISDSSLKQTYYLVISNAFIYLYIFFFVRCVLLLTSSVGDERAQKPLQWLIHFDSFIFLIFFE